jgi:hypothetical protein
MQSDTWTKTRPEDQELVDCYDISIPSMAIDLFKTRLLQDVSMSSMPGSY